MNTDTIHTLKNLQFSLAKLDAELRQANRTRGADILDIHARYHQTKADVLWITHRLKTERVTDCFLL